MTNLSEKSVRFSTLFCNFEHFLGAFYCAGISKFAVHDSFNFMEQGLSPCSLFANNKLKTCATPDINF